MLVTKYMKKPGSGNYINVYKLDVGRAYRDLDILIFRKASPRWFNFILQNSIEGYVPKYDIVIGPMTDGDNLRGIMTRYRELYRNNISFDVKKAIKEVSPHLRDKQILYHSKRSEKYLKFIYAYKEVE